MITRLISRHLPRLVLALACLALGGQAFAEESRGTIRVACLGDSITFGARANPETESYPAQLQELLGSGFEVRNFGIGGATLLKAGKPKVWQALPQALEFEPQVVIISLGTNDTVGGKRRNWEHEAEFIPDYRELLDTLANLRTGPRILVCTPTDMILSTPGLSEDRIANLKERRPRLLDLCQRIRELVKASEREHNIGIVELQPILRGKPEYVSEGDGVHPTAAGYRAIAEHLAPIVRTANQRPEKGIIKRGNSRTLEEINATYTEMPKVTFTPPANRFAHLPKTIAKLKAGSSLRIVMLGDSIINDTSRSDWNLLVEQQYPGVIIEKVTSVRGSTGCWHYQEKPNVQTYVLDHDPDLVIIGGISQRDDIDAIRSVIHQIKEKSATELLLMTGPFGRVDPLDEAIWKSIAQPAPESYEARLHKLAIKEGAEFFDIKKAWAEYIRGSGRETESFKRDPVHANPQGEQILARILENYFSPKE